ncbi:MAG TPA: hypothetical protein VEJ63_11740 [Planctomycetota bacterium]|nr:hypothetical protein [Planctomycetota bacterium]
MLMNVVAIPVWGFMGIIGVSLIGIIVDAPPPLMNHPTWSKIAWAAFAVGCLTCYWLFILIPSRDHLILFERGLRYQCGYVSGVVKIDELRAVRIGRDLTAFERFVDTINSRGGKEGRLIEAASTQALTLELNSGKNVELRWALRRFKTDDLMVFFQKLVEQRG